MCRQTLTSRVNKRYLAYKQKLKEVLQAVNYVCTTADLWTSRNKSYMGVTCHWIDPVTLERRSACLVIRRVIGSHTYDVIGKLLESIHSEFEIVDKIIVTITDSGANFLKAFREFSTVFNENSTVGADDEYDGDAEDEVRELRHSTKLMSLLPLCFYLLFRSFWKWTIYWIARNVSIRTVTMTSIIGKSFFVCRPTGNARVIFST